MEHRVLLIGEDKGFLDKVGRALRQEGFATMLAAQECLDAMEPSLGDDVHCIVLDVARVQARQLRLCRHIRARVDAPLVLLLSEESSERERIAALDAGVDDCLVKPVGPGLVVAHVRARLERSRSNSAHTPPDGVLDFGELRIDTARRRIEVRGETPHLTPKEFDLLVTLARNEGRALRASELLKEVWGYDKACATRTLDVHVSRLRAKIERHQRDPRFIVTVPCVGYTFQTPSKTRDQA